MALLAFYGMVVAISLSGVMAPGPLTALTLARGRRDALAMLKEMENDGEMPTDDRRRAEKRVQELTDEFITKIDEMTSQKESEVLEV